MLVTLATALAASAADDKDAARRAFSEGAKYYALNEYVEALAAFKRAYWNYQDPTFLYNIAQCHRMLKHKAEAIDFYRSYLRNAPNAKNRADVEKLIAELDAALQKDHAVATAPPAGPMPSAESAPPPTSNGTSAPPPSAGTSAPSSATTSGPSATASTPASSPALALTTTAPPRRAERPLWKKAWFWGVVGGAAVVVAGVAIGVGVATSTPRDPTPSLGHATVN
jgi:tetratricopeptide (TPR) repeat protein